MMRIFKIQKSKSKKQPQINETFKTKKHEHLEIDRN